MFIHKNKKQKAVEQDFVQAGLCFLTFGYNGKKYTFQISHLSHYTYTQSTQSKKTYTLITLSALFVQNIFLRQKIEFILLKTM